jgi:hypothetical protein
MDPKSPEGQAYVEAQEKEKKENERFSIGELNKKRGK